jgi:two-component system chemotaxis response regulator CheB
MYTVIVIDDSSLMRRVLKDMISSIDEFDVVATAKDAYEARELIKDYEPDLVTIDINMPKMDGVTFLRKLMKLHPMPAVVISGEGARGNDIFDDGAVGFIPKAEQGESQDDFKARLKDILLNLTFLLTRYTKKKPRPRKTVQSSKASDNTDRKIHPDEYFPSKPAMLPGKKLVAIGSSTGGVESLLKVFEKLQPNLPPIVITQHIPYGFSSSFAQRLDRSSVLNVKEAEDGDLLQKGHAYLAPGNMHMLVNKTRSGDYVISLSDAPRISRHKPSVDVMFRSVNASAGGGALAVMMTGMGDDGAIASKELYDNGAYVATQSEKSCVVYGMPAKVVELGASKEVVDLDNIAQLIIDYSKGLKR